VIRFRHGVVGGDVQAVVAADRAPFPTAGQSRRRTHVCRPTSSSAGHRGKRAAPPLLGVVVEPPGRPYRLYAQIESIHTFKMMRSLTTNSKYHHPRDRLCHQGAPLSPRPAMSGPAEHGTRRGLRRAHPRGSVRRHSMALGAIGIKIAPRVKSGRPARTAPGSAEAVLSFAPILLLPWSECMNNALTVRLGVCSRVSFRVISM
jgi:hypothetical protein